MIEDEEMLNKFLKLIIHSMRTIDGVKDTANKILESLNKQAGKEYLLTNRRKKMSEQVRQEISKRNEHTIFRKVYLKYLLLRIRAKISFIAFEKRMTITELFFVTILSTF